MVDHGPSGTHYVAHGVIRTRASDQLWDRLHVIYEGLRVILAAHKPTALSLEQCFVSKNARSALFLGHARGAIMVACKAEGLAVHEYAPSAIKAAVTGHGRADKDQVAQMIRVLLRLTKAPPSDASDALGAALCHAHSQAFRDRMPADLGRLGRGGRRGAR